MTDGAHALSEYKVLSMKQIIVFFALLLSVTLECAAFRYHIEGRTSNSSLEGCTVTLSDGNVGSPIATDTVRNGRISISGECADSFSGHLVWRTADGGKNGLQVMVEEGRATVDLDSRKQISGGLLFEKSDEFIKKYFEATVDEAPGLLLGLIKENPDNALGEMALSNYADFCSPDEWDAACETVSEHIRLKPQMRMADDNFRRMRRTWVGEPFAEITGMTPAGVEAKLSDYVGKGKYVLVDFWASWCGSCIEISTHELVPLYDRYKADGRFEIVGVAVSDATEKSVASIERHGYEWPQIVGCGSAPMSAYGFKAIPMLILFDPEGKVVARSSRSSIPITQINNILGQ